MKAHIIFYIAMGLAGVFAGPVSQQTTDDEKAISENPVSNETGPKLVKDTALDKTEPDQMKTVTNENPDSSEGSFEKNDGGEMEIVIQEQIIEDEDDVTAQTQSDINEDVPFVGNLLPMNIEDEIMETAKGFVPIRIFKRKQIPRRRFSTRRYFKRYPYKKFHYYPYAAFYHPSSLRFY